MAISKQKLLKYTNGKAGLAKILNIGRSAVSMWEKIPARRCYEIEKYSKGEFKAEDLMKINLKSSSTTKCTDKSRRVTSNVRKTG